MFVRNAEHIIRKEFTIHVDPIAPDLSYLFNQMVQRVPGEWIPYIIGDKRPCLYCWF